MNRLPDEDEVHWPRGKSCSGLKSNKTIFCPSLRCFVGMVSTCYNCQIGFNGSCDSLNEAVKKEPQILTEIYKAVPELKQLDCESSYIVYKKKLFDLNKVKVSSKLDGKQLFSVTNKYSVTLRFVPKYEEFKQENENVKFFIERLNRIVDFSELIYFVKTGDTVYSLKKDEKLADTLTLINKLEKLNE